MSRKRELEEILGEYFDIWNHSLYTIKGECFWLVVRKGEMVMWNNFHPQYVKYPPEDMSLEEFESLLVMMTL